MSGLFEQTQTTEQDNLSEYRLRRVQQIEGEIVRHLGAMDNAASIIESGDAAIADLLVSFEQESLFKVDGYANMSEYARVRWPAFSKGRLSQMLTFGRINAQIDKYNQEQEFTNPAFCKLPRAEHEGQARALNAIPDNERMETYALAVETTTGAAPSARVITETHDALNGKEATHERISRLDTGRGGQQTGEAFVKSEQARGPLTSRVFGYVDPATIETLTGPRKVMFTYVRPAVPAKNLREAKVPNLSIPFRYLEAQGWTAPRHIETEDGDGEDDGPDEGSFLRGRDFSELDALTAPQASLVDSFFAEEDAEQVEP